jgi:hypothetical protein
VTAAIVSLSQQQMIYHLSPHIVPYEVMRMSEGTTTTTHERLARIKENYWDRDWDIARMLSAANRNYGEHPSESDE